MLHSAKDNGSSCSTPIMNGSHDSLDEEEMNDNEFNSANKEFVDGNDKGKCYISQETYRGAVGMYRLDSPQFMPDGSPLHHGQSVFREVDSPSASGSVQCVGLPA